MEDENNRSTSPIDGAAKEDSHVHDTTQLRLGGEYLLMLEKTIIPLRAGVFYDPQPSQKHPDDSSTSCQTNLEMSYSWQNRNVLFG